MPGVRVFVTTLAPITLPYLEKIIFRSVARVNDDKPDTHKLRLAVDDDDDDEAVFDADFDESTDVTKRTAYSKQPE